MAATDRVQSPGGDLVRRVFEVNPRVFSLGKRLEPISVRDQMVRACLVVDRAAHDGLIGTERPLAVVGAGACGVTAALRARNQHDVDTTIFEMHSMPCTLQASCNTRRIDPTLYDWPAPHWAEGCIPWTGSPSMPLSWSGDMAHFVARQWREEFQNNYLLHSRPKTEVIGCTSEGEDGVRLELRSLDSTPVQWVPTFSAVILACGHGAERTWVQDADSPNRFRGFRFWEWDPFENLNCGLLSNSDLTDDGRPRVVIHGSGDGAIQDLLRVTLRNPDGVGPFSLKEFFLDLQSPSSSLRSEDWQSITTKLTAAEEQASRSLIWAPHDGTGYDRGFDSAVLERLDTTYKEALNSAFGTSGIPDGVAQVIRRWLRPDLGSIDLVFRRSFFSQCYPINRFMAHILLRYFENHEPDRVKFLPGTTFTAVTGEGHECMDQPGDCHGKVHRVTLQHDGTNWDEHYDVVIIRGGMEKLSFGDDSITGVGAIRLARQLLPYHLPY